MAHRAKHRGLKRISGGGPAATKPTTGIAAAMKKAAKAHRELPVVAFLKTSTQDWKRAPQTGGRAKLRARGR